MSPPKTILVIEDEPALREAIKLKLEKAGIEVWTAASGEEGLSVLQKKIPNLVWLDLLLPGINGVEVLRAIKKDTKATTPKVVVVSVSSGEEKVREVLRLGALDYIVKSNYSIDDIVKRAEHLLLQS